MAVFPLRWRWPEADCNNHDSGALCPMTGHRPNTLFGLVSGLLASDCGTGIVLVQIRGFRVFSRETVP